MRLSPPTYGFCFAIILGVTSPAMSDDANEPEPTDGEINKQIQRLDPKNSDGERLDAAKWFEKHLKAKNVHLAVPALAQSVRSDPSPKVRTTAVMTLASIAVTRKEPCPLVVVEAILDRDASVRMCADAYSALFTTFAPGSVEVLLRCVKSEDTGRRSGCLMSLAHAGGKSKIVLDALKKAMEDKNFRVRHNAHAAMFHATDNLEEFLTWLIRVQEDQDGVLNPVDPDSESREKDLIARNLACVGAVYCYKTWSDERPDDLAPALLKLLDAPTPYVRRSAARLIGACAIKTHWVEVNGRKGLDLTPVPPDRRKPPQRSAAASRFEKLNAEDRLRELSYHDPDISVRAAAYTALERLASVREKGLR